MSDTVCPYPIVSAIRKADDIIGKDRNWGGVNAYQIFFLNHFYTPETLADLARIPELESIASLNAADINAWLAQRKFNITLDPFPEHGFGTACMLDVGVQWLEVGKIRDIHVASGNIIPGVFLTEGVSFVKNHLGVGARIATESGDLVYLMRFDNKRRSRGLELFDLVASLLDVPVRDYEGVLFPMVDLDQQPDISWLLDMETKGEDGYPYLIAQAKQQTKFKMNEVGARVKSAVAIGVMRGITSHRLKKPLVIDGPFLVWIKRPGLSLPFFVGHITSENMKNPGDLSDM